ncbi:XdhC family protein [Paenibacillus sp. EPM92]|uniref:XdhC family protein n=1 Tax=Paenibacillus sp. EPM92 TaxID=1561195 RepID=UPI0019152E7D|nr:XdhC family protein [Paenibacillus sp. EPM92]
MSQIEEFKKVFKQIRQSWERGDQAAMLMIITVIGSAYRRPGAKMMMSMDGTMCGTLSGGCLEGDLLSWAEKAIQDQVPLTVKYDLTENELWGLGIGCKGAQEILIVPVDPADSFWSQIDYWIHQEARITYILECTGETRAAFVGEDTEFGDTASLPTAVRKQAILHAGSRTRAEVMHVEGRRFVIDTVRPSERLIVTGAGHDAVPVVDLASKAGFAVTVLDPRESFNNINRFPSAQHVVMEPDAADPSMFPDGWWVIMNHHLNRDEASLRLALHSRPKFVGVLGPLSRTEQMLANIGLPMSEAPIYSPVGLDLGAETIDEVAVSIVSQLMSLRNNRNAAPLHGRAKIHA